MRSRGKLGRNSEATTPGAASCPPEQVLQWAWAEACGLLYCGEDPNQVSQDELKRRFHTDLTFDERDFVGRSNLKRKTARCR
jgi:hypothetical protein